MPVYFKHLDRLAAWQEGRIAAPVLIELDLTNLCNHGCPGCVYSHLVNVSKDSIPFPLAVSIVEQLADCGVKAITFSGGGEPLVYGQDKVLELMKLAVGRGVQCALITNGALLTSTEFLELCEWVRVSLDGHDAETFARFHGRSEGEFQKVCGRLRALCAAAAARRDAGLPCATVSAGFLTKPGEWQDFKPTAEFCRREFPGLDFISFRPLVLNTVDDPTRGGGGWEQSRPADFEMLAAAMDLARSTAAPLPVLWAEEKYRALHQPGFGRTYGRCHASFVETTIAADARVYLCCHVQGQDRFCLGDLRERSFRSIWWSGRSKEVLDSFDPRATCPPACRLHVSNTMLEDLLRPVTHENYV